MFARFLSGSKHLLFGASFLGISCASSQEIPRRNGPEFSQGRAIPAEAYAYYARGLYQLRRGQTGAAEKSFLSAVNEDPRSGLAWAALISIRCQHSLGAALSTFKRAESHALRKSPLHVAVSMCQLTQGQNSKPPERREATRLALKHALTALSLEPDSARSNQAAYRAYLASGERIQAEKVKTAYKLYTGLELEPSVDAQTDSWKLSDVDRSLIDEDLKGARQRAATLLTPGQLASRALAWGRPRLALESAQSAAAANPRDADAIAILALLGSPSTSRYDLSSSEGLSLVCALLVAAELKREMGTAAAQQFLSHFEEDLKKSNDALVLSLAEWTEAAAQR